MIFITHLHLAGFRREGSVTVAREQLLELVRMGNADDNPVVSPKPRKKTNPSREMPGQTAHSLPVTQVIDIEL
jgi:hypothetical protein